MSSTARDLAPDPWHSIFLASSTYCFPMATTIIARKLHQSLSHEEIRRPFEGRWGDEYPPILTPAKLAQLLGLSRKTIDQWTAQGRLDGAFRKRGKHNLIWRDRALDIIFNGKDWEEHVKKRTNSSGKQSSDLSTR